MPSFWSEAKVRRWRNEDHGTLGFSAGVAQLRFRLAMGQA